MKKLNSYKNTSVNWAKSQAQIGKLLDQVGIKDVRFTFMQSQQSIICEFNYPGELEGLAVKQRADLQGADLRGADLRGADLRGADLRGADLQGADLRGEKLDKAPLMMQGLKWDVLITKQQIFIGCEQHKAEEWFKFNDKEISEMHDEALVWWKAHKKFIKSAWELHCKEV